MLDTQVVENPKTLVKVAVTTIKYFDKEKNQVIDIKLVGRYNIAECRKIVSHWNEKNLYIDKTNDNEQFYVDSIALYQLKETE